MIRKILTNAMWTILVLAPFMVLFTWDHFFTPIIGAHAKWIPPIISIVVLIVGLRAFIKGYGVVEPIKQEVKKDK
ncbi:hypothetical protein [Companilactobacillus versmoldensis]|uniref:Uncharacterized protein n=1 Tax=Companilactobacillus versmoldensis DSM 14857 = KCTC 3814 TaxID=1423815 RepID=A0A0R1SCL6_9LACO|nr:hypothetical protein [Companilactobacillus versmoldensis]KRL66903.1 hypothetical protein FC27_GL002229 [Companilactobacillus versmoldensis DSM 14857 = KCTC 3814]